MNLYVDQVQLIFQDKEAATAAAQARLDNKNDAGITTKEQVAAYAGPTFKNGERCTKLHVLITDGVVIVSMNATDGIDTGKGVRYVYRIDQLARIKTVEGL